MKDNLKQLIDEHKADFEVGYRPSDEIWDQIDDAVERKKNHPAKLSISYKKIAVITSLAALFLLFSVVILRLAVQPSVENHIALTIDMSDLEDNAEETLRFYSTSIEKNKSNLNLNKIPEDLKEEWELLNEDFSELEQEFKQKINQDRLIQALIENYKVRKELLDKIIEKQNSNEVYSL